MSGPGVDEVTDPLDLADKHKRTMRCAAGGVIVSLDRYAELTFLSLTAKEGTSSITAYLCRAELEQLRDALNEKLGEGPR